MIDGVRCFGDGWCWDAPRPQGVDFHAVDATPDAASAWAVGSLGGAMRRCQGQWYAMETGTDATLYDVWHPTADLAFAVGGAGTVLAWDGVAWSKLAVPTSARLLTVWGSAPDDVWIGGEPDEAGAVLMHYDGRSWSRAPETAGQSFAIFDIGGPAADALVAVGGSFDCDFSLRFDGAGWTSLPPCHGYPDFGPFTSVAWTDQGEFLALFDGFNTSRVYRLEGGDWVESHYTGSSGVFGPLFRDASGRPALVEAADDPAARILGYDGTGWPPTGEVLQARPTAAWARPGGAEGWAVGTTTTLLERAGDGVWSQAPGIASLSGGAVHLGGAGPEDLWLITDDQLVHRDAAGWTVTSAVPEGARLASVDPSGRPYVVTYTDALMHYDGGTWTPLPPVDSPSPIDVLYALAPNDVWAVAYDPMHFDGTTWSEPWGYCDTLSDPSDSWLPDGRRFRRAPDGHVWLVGDRGAFYFDLPSATCWRLIASDPSALELDSLVDTAWLSESDQWAITRSGKLYHRQGNVLVLATSLLATPDAQVDELVATPEGKLRFVYTEPEGSDWVIRIGTFDPLSTNVIATLTVPHAQSLYDTAVWLQDESHSLVAMPGAVLSHGYAPP